MPTDSELKEAAERLSEAVTACTIKLGGESATMDVEAANVRLKRVLAQRADDGEEVDADFLVEVGMRPMASHQGAFETPDGVVIFNPWEYGWVVCNGLPKINTRGQLRQLLSALNVKSGGDAG